jgi:DNA-binding winged helix-turn-helix (wHTH) protein
MPMTDSDLAEIVEISGFRLDRGRRLLTRSNGKPVPLPTKAFDTLLYLVSHPGRVVDKHDLLDAVWPGITVEENTLNHAISAIRRALGDQRSKPRYIATIQGRGYQFVATVTTKTGSSAEPDMFGRMRRGTVVTMGATAGIVALAVLLTLSGFVPSRLLNSKDFTAYEVGLTTILTNDSGLELDPALSPDGLFYAYTDGPIGQTDIFVRSVAGDEAFNLTQNLAGTHSWPRWSPDGMT